MSETTPVPKLKIKLQPEGRPPIALGYWFPPISGVPDTESALAGALRIAASSPGFSGLPIEEVDTTLAALAQTLCRAAYHKLRFDECIAHAKARREVLGGPVVADWYVVPPITFEAIAFLGAARTIVDILVYLAARRAGKSPNNADRWSVTEAISPKYDGSGTPPTRYDLPEILAIRKHGPWFANLNDFRNAIYHRGWKQDLHGFYLAGDSADEVSMPEFNAMLLPDIEALRKGERPHKWTYANGQRLDDLVNESYSTLLGLLEHICVDVWGIALPKPGTLPRAEHPSTMLHLPHPAVLEDANRRILPVFSSRIAAREFRGFAEHTAGFTIRAVRPTMVGDGIWGYLLPIPTDDSDKNYQVQFYEMSDGHLRLTHSLDVDVRTECLMPSLINLRTFTDHDVVYVWQSRTPSAPLLGVRQ